MDIPSRPFRRVVPRVDVPTRLDAEKIPETVREVKPLNNEDLLDSIVLEVHTVTRIIPDNQPRRREEQPGYNRNAHRQFDERLYHRKRRQVFYAIPTGVFIVAAIVMLWGPFMAQPHVLSAQQASVVDTAQPDIVPFAGSSDEKPAANYIETYKVAANRPRVLSIQSLGLRARVVEVGADGRSQPQLPKNSYDAGWYNVSVSPGSLGAVVVSGACSGSVGQGVFHRLNELSNDAQIDIEKGDGTIISYRVQSIVAVSVEKLEMTDVLLPSHGFDRGLSLIGCAGAYDVKTNDFASRIIVRAVPI